MLGVETIVHYLFIDLDAAWPTEVGMINEQYHLDTIPDRVIEISLTAKLRHGPI